MTGDRQKQKVLFTSHVARFQRFNRPFMQMFRENGWEVHYASMGEEQILDCDKSFTISIERSPLSLKNIHAYRQLKKIIDSNHYDIIHTHTPMGSVVTRLAARNARKRGTRVIYTAHGFHFFKGAPLINWLVFYPIERLMAKYTDILITINKEDYGRAKRKLRTNVIYVPGVGIDHRHFAKRIDTKRRAEIRSSLGIQAGDFVLIYPAELNKNKNQSTLLHAMRGAIMKDQSIHLLLPGIDSMNGYHRDLAKTLGITANIHFLGYRKDIPELMQISDASISTSFREGLPVNIMEAMASGLPIISTPCRGATELIRHNHNGIITDFSANTITEAIMRLRNDNALRQSFSQKSLELSKKYTIGSIKTKMKSIYDLLGNNPLRVLHVVTAMNRGGLETMIMNHYRAIDRTRVQFDFLVHRAEGADYDAEIISLGGKIYHLPPIGPSSIFSYGKRLRQLLREHPEYRIIHSHIDALSALPLRAAKKRGIPVRIAHSHNADFPEDAKYLVRATLKHCIASQATHLFACSREAGDFMFGDDKQYSVINNAINTRSFLFDEAVRNRVRKGLSIPKNAIVVGHVGRFDKQKNHRFLLDIFTELLKNQVEAVLLLVGAGRELEDIRQRAQQTGVIDNIIFTGLRADIPDLMQAMDVFVMPSLHEGLPLVSIEAQASGLPCLFSDKVTREVDITGACTFIPLSAPAKDWVAAIQKSAIERSDRKERGLSVEQTSYNIATSAQKLTDFYLREAGINE